MIDKDLAKWLHSSLAVYFKSVADKLSLPFYVIGVDEQSDDTMRKPHAELRFNGPHVKNLSKNYWKINMDVNIMLTDYMYMSTVNAYDINEWAGRFLTAMLDVIPVKKYGDGEDLIGCLTQRKTATEPVKVYHFGQVSKEDRIRQAVVDGKFEMNLLI